MASLLRMIFAPLAHTHERMHERLHCTASRDFLQAKLDSEVNASLLLNDHGEIFFYYIILE